MRELLQDRTIQVLLFLVLVTWSVVGGIMYQWHMWNKQPYEPLYYPIPELVEEVKSA